MYYVPFNTFIFPTLCVYVCVLVCKGVIYADQTHVAQGALLNGGINKKASGASVGRCEKWSNLLLS